MLQKEMTIGDQGMLILGGQWAVNTEFGEERRYKLFFPTGEEGDG